MDSEKKERQKPEEEEELQCGGQKCINGLTKCRMVRPPVMRLHEIFLRTEQDRADRDGPINFQPGLSGF